MAKFEIEFTEELWKRVVIEADSLETAREIFYSGEYDQDRERIIGGELQDSIDISELEEN